MTQKPLEITDISSSSLDENHQIENGLRVTNRNHHLQDEEKPKNSSSTIQTMGSFNDDEPEPSAVFVAMSSSDDELTEDEPVMLENEDGEDQQEHHYHEPHGDHHTTVWQTFVHLVKGYIGPGCLSLPWAMSQLGIIPGVIICFALAAWSSYNCWIVVELKRQLMAANPSNSRRQLTYPDVAGCMYGSRAQSITALSVGTQQLAICTVFFSFCGDNLKAVLDGLMQAHVDENHPGFSHATVITFCFPVVLALAMIPDLKGLASASAFGTVLLMVGFGILGVLVMQEWSVRPSYVPETGFPYFNTDGVSQYPLAACALLYSYEGICLILPIESAMKKPEHFGWTFCIAMFLAAMTFSIVASMAVYVFGSVSDGSLTAFLLEHYERVGAREEFIWLLWIANAAVSLSVLVTFPLQLFPALELVQEALDGARSGPAFARVQTDEAEDGGDIFEDEITATATTTNGDSSENNGFAPVYTVGDDDDDNDQANAEQGKHHGTDAEAAVVARSSENGQEHFADEPAPSHENNDDDAASEASGSPSSLWLRFALVIVTYIIAIVIPNVQSLIALAGALAGSLTALILPPALAMANGGRIISVLSLVFGTIFGIVGTTAALLDINKSK